MSGLNLQEHKPNCICAYCEGLQIERLTAQLAAMGQERDKWERSASEVAAALDCAYAFIDGWGTDECVDFMVGTNPPAAILAARDARVRAEALREAAMCLPDGIGMIRASGVRDALLELAERAEGGKG